MRIVQTPPRFSSIGGVESYVRSLSAELAAMGHSVEVVCADAPGEKPSIPGVRAHYLKTAFFVANTNITPGLLPALLTTDCDLIHTQLPTPWSADLSMIAGRLKDVPLVLSYQNDIAGAGIFSTLSGLYNTTMLKVLLRSAGRIIISRSEFLSPHLRDHADRLEVIPPGVDIRIFSPMKREQIADIFFLSVLDEYHGYKKLDTLLQAVKIVRRDIPGIRVIVGGDGPMKGYYQNMARDLGLSQNVRFAGYISNPDLPDFYNSCRIFVLPSKDPVREGFGIVLLEAMACGRPVIATEIAGVAQDLVSSNAGIVIRRDYEAGELAQAIRLLLSGDKPSEEIARNARNLAMEKYAWTRIAERMDGVYRELVEGWGTS